MACDKLGAYLSDFGSRHGPLNILFIGENKKRGTSQTLMRAELSLKNVSRPTHILEQKFVKLLFAIHHTQPVSGINNPYNRICLFKIISPVGSKRPLASYIPFPTTISINGL
jgi:hypothetical protein